MRKAIVILAFVTALSLPAVAQGVAEANGQVLDREGNPIEGAVVTFWAKSNSEVTYEDTTNKKGRYFVSGMFSAVEDERWYLKCEAEGLSPVEVRIESRNVNKVLVGDVMTSKLKFGQAAPDIVIRPLGKATVDWTLAPAEEAEAEALAQQQVAAEAAAAESGKTAQPQKDPWVEALTLASAGSLEESVELFREAVEEEPENAERHETFAKILYRLEQHDEAEAEARKAVEIEPARVESQMVLFNVHDKRGDLEQARTILEAARTAAPQDTRILLRLAYVAKKTGDTAGAIAAYTQVTEADPDNAEAWLELANLHDEAGNLEASEGAYQKVVEIDPAGAHQTYYNLGATIIKRGNSSESDIERAIDAFRKALEIRPNYAKAAQELAIALITVGDKDGARDTLEVFVGGNPDAPEAPQMKALIQSLQ